VRMVPSQFIQEEFLLWQRYQVGHSSCPKRPQSGTICADRCWACIHMLGKLFSSQLPDMCMGPCRHELHPACPRSAH
jgi:hypothetical protein